MKNLKLIQYLLSSLVAFSFSLASADFKSGKEAIQKLQSYSTEKIKPKTARKTDSVTLSEDEIFDRLADAVEIALVEKSNQGLRQEIFRVTVMMLKYDPSQYAGELVLQLYLQDKNSFLEETKKLSTEDRKLLMEAVENARREKTEGNG